MPACHPLHERASAKSTTSHDMRRHRSCRARAGAHGAGGSTTSGTGPARRSRPDHRGSPLDPSAPRQGFATAWQTRHPRADSGRSAFEPNERRGAGRGLLPARQFPSLAPIIEHAGSVTSTLLTVSGALRCWTRSLPARSGPLARDRRMLMLRCAQERCVRAVVQPASRKRSRYSPGETPTRR
jgi:hypothetical protein